MAETFGIGPARASLIFAIEPAVYMLTLSLLAARAGRANKPRLTAAGLVLVGLSLPVLVLNNRLSAVYAAMAVPTQRLEPTTSRSDR